MSEDLQFRIQQMFGGLQAMATAQALEYEKWRRKRAILQRTPMIRMIVKLRKVQNSDGTVEDVVETKSSGMPVFNPRLQDILDTTCGFGYLGERVHLSDKDSKNVIEAHKMFNAIFSIVPPERVPFITSLFQTMNSQCDAYSRTRETDVPESFVRRSAIPTTPSFAPPGESEEKGIIRIEKKVPE